MNIDSIKLQRLIGKSSWNKEEFAKQANISRSTLQTILRTGVVKKEKDLHIIAELLGVELEILTIKGGPIVEDFNRTEIEKAGYMAESQTDFRLRLEACRKENELLLNLIRSKEDTIRAKDEIIEQLKRQLTIS